MIIIIITIINVIFCFCAKNMEGVDKKIILVPKTALWGSKKAILGNRCHETACRAAKRQPTGKPKVFRVTSGYGGLMIPLSRIRLSPEKVSYVGLALKNQILGQKHVLALPRSLPGIMINMKTLSFWCPVMIVAKNLEDAHKKWILGPKTALLGPKRPILGNRAQKTACRAAKRPPTEKPKVSRVASWYGGLMIPLSRVRLTPKNGGYMGVA